MSDLTFYGGLTGAFFGNQQFTSRNLTFYGAVVAIDQIFDWGRWLTFDSSVLVLTLPRLDLQLDQYQQLQCRPKHDKCRPIHAGCGLYHFHR